LQDAHFEIQAAKVRQAFERIAGNRAGRHLQSKAVAIVLARHADEVADEPDPVVLR
jgi:hypothetical protein